MVDIAHDRAKGFVAFDAEGEARQILGQAEAIGEAGERVRSALDLDIILDIPNLAFSVGEC
jgi:hypothetical protein